MKFQHALVMNVPYGTVLSLEDHLEGLQHDVCFSTLIGDVEGGHLSYSKSCSKVLICFSPLFSS